MCAANVPLGVRVIRATGFHVIVAGVVAVLGGS